VLAGSLFAELASAQQAPGQHDTGDQPSRGRMGEPATQAPGEHDEPTGQTPAGDLCPAELEHAERKLALQDQLIQKLKQRVAELEAGQP
jgi:hypothetical protein